MPYHVNSSGVIAPCKASKGPCPFGGIENHYHSKEEAQTAYEKIMKDFHSEISSFSKDSFHRSLIEEGKYSELYIEYIYNNLNPKELYVQEFLKITQSSFPETPYTIEGKLFFEFSKDIELPLEMRYQSLLRLKNKIYQNYLQKLMTKNSLIISIIWKRIRTHIILFTL